MLCRTWSSVILVLILYVCLLDATENEGNIKKRGAGTERTGTLALRTGSTGPTTPATPTCKVSSLTLVGDDSYYYACCEGTTITGPTVSRLLSSFKLISERSKSKCIQMMTR